MRWEIVWDAVVRILPIYFSNMFPPLVGGKRPVDLGKEFRGSRLLGDGKTWEGSISGVLASVIGGAVSRLLGVPYSLPVVLAMGALGILGDMLGSFIKRRIGLERGEMMPLLDQLMFVLVPLLILWDSIGLSFAQFLIVLSITPSLHLLSNWVGYFMGVKREPW